MPTMPNVVGQGLKTAEQALQVAGVLSPQSLGYFGTWPITAAFSRSTSAPGTVLAQSPAANANIAANGAVTLTVSEYPMALSYYGNSTATGT